MRNNIKGKNILITGITGFVGMHLSKALEEKGARVFGISRSKSGKNILKANIKDYSVVNDFIKKKRINMCFHLAGESIVERGEKDPYLTIKTNVEGTLNILELARRNNLEKIIIASTSHVYGDNKVPSYEEYTPRPSRPYETSKTCTDLIAQSYSDSYNLPVLIPRFVNIYGPGDLNFTRIIPKTIKSVIHDVSPKMWGGEAVREYLYIDDAIDAYLKLISLDSEKTGKNKIFNFGTNERIKVKDLIKKIIFLSGKNLKIEKIDNIRELEIERQYVSWKKSEKLLNWKPLFNLNEGLNKTYAWYFKYFKI